MYCAALGEQKILYKKNITAIFSLSHDLKVHYKLFSASGVTFSQIVNSALLRNTISAGAAVNKIKLCVI